MVQEPLQREETARLGTVWRDAYLLVGPYGGGRIVSDGTLERDSGLTYTLQQGQIEVGSWAGAVLVRTVRGDANLDWTVDYLDLGALATCYGMTAAAWSQGDFNADGQVDYLDLGVLATNYDAGAGGAAVAPEPASLLLWAAPAVIAFRRRRRRREA